MSGLNPSGPAQPNKEEAYTTAQNVASKAPGETHSHPTGGAALESRSGSNPEPSEAVPSSLGYGSTGPVPHAATDPAQEEPVTEAPKMATFGEDRIADAVHGKKPGSGGEQPGLESDLDRKKAEQAPLREEIKDQRRQNVDVGGVLGQQGGPANPVGKDNYPNTN